MSEPKSFSIAIMQIYPNLIPGQDFRVVCELDNQYIAEWNNSEVQPTQEQLEAAWNAYVANPPPKPLTDVEQLQKDQADLLFSLMSKGVI